MIRYNPDDDFKKSSDGFQLHNCEPIGASIQSANFYNKLEDNITLCLLSNVYYSYIPVSAICIIC